MNQTTGGCLAPNSYLRWKGPGTKAVSGKEFLLTREHKARYE